jgi:hypothetical protein
MAYKIVFFFTGPTAPVVPDRFFSLMIILQTVGLLWRVISSSQGLYLNTGQHKHRIYTYTHQTSMPCVGFEPTIPVSERAKTVHALDRSVTVTGYDLFSHPKVKREASRRIGFCREVNNLHFSRVSRKQPFPIKKSCPMNGQQLSIIVLRPVL